MENPVRSTRADDGTVVVTVRGEIDFTNCDEVAQAVRDALNEWAPRSIKVDVRDATFMDSTGLGALIEGSRAAYDARCEYAVVNPTENFHRVLTVTGLCELFGLSDGSSSSSAMTQTGA